MHIRYKYELNYFFDFNLWHYKKTRSIYGYKKMKVAILSLLLAIVFLGALVLWLVTDGDFFLFGVGTTLMFIAVGILALSYDWFQHRMVKWMLGQSVKKIYEKQCIATTLLIEDKGLKASSAQGESLVYWADLQRIEETNDYVFVYVSEVGAHVIPKSKIQEGDLPSFLAEVRHRMGPMKANKTTDGVPGLPP